MKDKCLSEQQLQEVLFHVMCITRIVTNAEQDSASVKQKDVPAHDWQELLLRHYPGDIALHPGKPYVYLALHLLALQEVKHLPYDYDYRRLAQELTALLGQKVDFRSLNRQMNHVLNGNQYKDAYREIVSLYA